MADNRNHGRRTVSVGGEWMRESGFSHGSGVDIHRPCFLIGCSRATRVKS